VILSVRSGTSEEPTDRSVATLTPWVMGLSLLTLLFALPHSFEDFVYGIPARFGLSVMLAGILLSLAFIAQVVALLLMSHRRLSGVVVTLIIALFWFVGAVADHLQDVQFTSPYREGLISKATEVGIMVCTLILGLVLGLALYKVIRKTR